MNEKNLKSDQLIQLKATELLRIFFIHPLFQLRTAFAREIIDQFWVVRFGVFPGISMNQNDYKRIDFCFGSDNWKIVIHKMHECIISSWTKFAFVWFHTKIPYFNLLNHANLSLYSSKIWSILSAILLLAKKIKFQKIYLDEQRENGAIWKTWNFGQKEIKFCYCCRVHSFEVLTMSKFCTF